MQPFQLWGTDGRQQCVQRHPLYRSMPPSDLPSWKSDTFLILPSLPSGSSGNMNAARCLRLLPLRFPAPLPPCPGPERADRSPFYTPQSDEPASYGLQKGRPFCYLSLLFLFLNLLNPSLYMPSLCTKSVRNPLQAP